MNQKENQKDTSVARQEPSPMARGGVQTPKITIRPAVDIFETEDKLVLLADLPGVDKEGLDVDLERGVLTLKGELKTTERGEPLFREFSVGSYFRQFELSDTFDSGKTSAELKNGVLTLTLAKSESAKPKRIEIRH